MHKNNPKIRLEKRFISITYKMRRNVRQLISSWIWIQVFMVTHVRFLLEQLLVGVRHPVKLFWNREFEAYSIQLNSDFAVALKNEVEYWAKISYHNFSISNRVRILTKLQRPQHPVTPLQWLTTGRWPTQEQPARGRGSPSFPCQWRHWEDGTRQQSCRWRSLGQLWPGRLGWRSP